MGALTRKTLSERPFLLFGLLLLLPALGFGLLGWRSLERERAAHEREVANEAHDVVERRLDAVAGELEALALREGERPYFVYQPEFAPEGTVFQQLDFQPSPLTRAPEDPRVLGYFQWELGSKGVFSTPEVFGPKGRAWADAFTETYGPTLRARLSKAPQDFDLEAARRVDHTLRVVKANEERGQLIEEIQIARNLAREQGQQRNPSSQTGTRYLEVFYDRATDAPVPVRYSAFRHLARPRGAKGPALVAWRLAWIPAEHKERREVGRDRWLLQGYALDTDRDLPAPWETVGAVALGRRLEIEDLGEKAGTYEASLADALNAEVVPDASGKRVASAELALIGVPSQALLEDAWVTARTRFLWLLAGVMAVVATGLVILTRGLRREIALARRKEDFLAAVTHELKTPLTGIRMHAEMLRQGWVSDPEASERYADRILSETDRLGHLVDQVLDLAALERGVARAQVAPGDLATVVQDAVQTLASRAVEKGAEIRVQVQDGLPQISFDARLVKPLVLNLIDNALKYGVGGEATSIDVTLRKDTGAVLLEVRDQGPGFDAKVLKRPFEPFHRAGNELTRQAPGVGIGLALVRRYAEAHDARVTVDSEPGAGATVSVRFPV